MIDFFPIFARTLSIWLAYALFFSTSSALSAPLRPENSVRDALSVFDAGNWKVVSQFSLASERNCGGIGDIPAPGSYLSSPKASFATWNPSFGLWKICSPEATLVRAWGMPGDLPVAEDYNNDGLTDYAVFRPSEGKWYILENTGGLEGGGVQVLSWGMPGDSPLPADYNGDGVIDLAVYRQDQTSGGGRWLIRYSKTSTREENFGLLGDVPVPADYDGDGVVDLAVWRPSSAVWYVKNSKNNEVSVTSFGLPGDIPLSIDSDADGLSDKVVYRPQTAKFYALASSGEAASGEVVLGAVGNRLAASALSARTDRSVPLDFNGDRLSDLLVARKGEDGSLFFLFNSGTGSPHPKDIISLGEVGDTIVQGDFDGDLLADLGTVGTEAGFKVWQFLLSGEQEPVPTRRILTYGLIGDQILPADFDGDGRMDMNVVRDMPDGGKLWIPNASGVSPIEPVAWGLVGDKVFSSDIDGDGRSDFIVVRKIGGELHWFIRLATGVALPARAYGFDTDEALVGDFDGDGRGDIAVIREVNGFQMVIVEGLAPYYWGLASDRPLSGNFLLGTKTSSAVWRTVGDQGFFFVRGATVAKPFGVVGDLPVSALGVTETAPVEGGGDSLGDSSGDEQGGGGVRLNCSTRSSVSAQESGFVWKPVSEGDGKLVVLFGASRAGSILRAALVDSQAQGDVVLETLSFAGNTNGGRPTFRANRRGSDYPSGVILVRQSTDQSVHCIDVPSPGRRID